MKEIRDGDDKAQFMLRECTETRWSYMVPASEEGQGPGTCISFENGILTTYMLAEPCYFVQQETTREALEEKGQDFFFRLTLIAIDLSDHYRAFTYDEERGLYRYEAPANSKGIKVDFIAFEGMGNHLDRVELKFKEGRLAYVHWINYSTNFEGEREILSDVRDCYYDYGKTQVVIPENALPYPMEG